MDDKVKQCRNEYYRQYRKANKEKLKEINARYWNKVAEKNNKTQEVTQNAN